MTVLLAVLAISIGWFSDPIVVDGYHAGSMVIEWIGEAGDRASGVWHELCMSGCVNNN